MVIIQGEFSGWELDADGDTEVIKCRSAVTGTMRIAKGSRLSE